jgi:hypothetical protein
VETSLTGGGMVGVGEGLGGVTGVGTIGCGVGSGGFVSSIVVSAGMGGVLVDPVGVVSSFVLVTTTGVTSVTTGSVLKSVKPTPTNTRTRTVIKYGMVK